MPMKMFSHQFANEGRNLKIIEGGIPTACREGYLNKDNMKTFNEQLHWLNGLQETGPIWCRSRHFNCVGQKRYEAESTLGNFDVEISRRLFSLWGNSEYHKNILDQFKNSSKPQMISSILSCCACLKYNLNEWSPEVMDEIVKNATKLYPDLLRKLNITDNGFQLIHLNNQMLKLEGINFYVQFHKVTSGNLYMPFGSHVFNLARALMWFFKYYQFGLLMCQNQCLAFGYAVDMDHGFFMYSCQADGKQTNSHILRTNHLQILLYCLILTLNVNKENEKFTIYALGIQMQEGKKEAPIKKLSFNLKDGNRKGGSEAKLSFVGQITKATNPTAKDS
ncbi:uncharacterized protein isoform X2 [Musca autumnalis]|uniref:uncharacterized protein isoform X2 n=1 Tax=Musca autumnalis TaxID=221902 RepID=UPI003CF67BFC